MSSTTTTTVDEAGRCSLPRAVLVLAAALGVLALTVRLPVLSPGERTGALTFWVASTFRWSTALLAGYLAAATLVALWGRARARVVPANARPVRTGFLRRVLLPTGLTLVLTGGPTGSAFGISAEAPPTIVLVEDGVLAEDSPPTSGLDTPAPAVAAPTVELAPPVTGFAVETVEHAVAPGEHFWSIATHLVARELGRPPSEREIRSRWLNLIETNRSRLIDPDNPDLLLPAQVLRVHP